LERQLEQSSFVPDFSKLKRKKNREIFRCTWGKKDYSSVSEIKILLHTISVKATIETWTEGPKGRLRLRCPLAGSTLIDVWSKYHTLP
jgi:hypothetical protein